MQTILTEDPNVAAELVVGGGLVAFPTETVFGLAADARREICIRKVFTAKNRPSDNPLIVHLGDKRAITRVTQSISPMAQLLIDVFVPGPLTLLLPRKVSPVEESLPTIVTAGSPLVGVRVPQHELARAFLEACNVPIVAPSANRSGRPSPTTWQAVRSDLDGRIDGILMGEPTAIGLESTVVDASGEIPIVIRPGAISLEQIRDVVGSARMAESASERASSPGTRYRHYAPSATVLLVDAVKDINDASSDDAYIGLDALPPEAVFGHARVCRNVADYAQALFRFFRECDDKGINRIFCQRVEQTGLGTAVSDRLSRAAQG